MTTLPETVLRENLARVRQRIADAARRAGRDPGEIRLVAVTKYVTSDAARRLVEAGCDELGESRPQELWEKAAALSELRVRWHLIGHLQRNKVRRTLTARPLIHAVDSLRLLEEISAEAAKASQPADVLVEVKTSSDAAKHGLTAAEVEQVLVASQGLPGVRIGGLMTMASLEGGSAEARRCFAALRELRERLRGACPPGVELKELSMGMSGDFEEAILEGATIVRIGSAITEGVA